MNAGTFMRSFAVLALVAGMAACGATETATSTGAAASTGSVTGLFDQLGGMSNVRSLSDTFVNNVASDTRTSNMLSNTNVGSLKTKLSDQLCAMIGGGCKAPLTGNQIADAGKNVDAKTSSALTDNFTKALDTIKATPIVKESMTKLVGPQLSGIVTALL
jgi:hypothetical protein